MAKILRLVALAWALSLGLPLVDSVGPAPTGAFVAAAYADAPAELSKLEEKMADIASLIRKVLFVFVILGISFAGFKFMSGDPHAWRYTLGVVVGSTLIYTAESIVAWLGR